MRNCVHTHMDDTPLPSVRICTHFADPPPPYSAYVIKVRSQTAKRKDAWGYSSNLI